MNTKVQDVGLLILRLVLAWVFISHGVQKFANIDMVSQFFGMLGLPAFMAYVVATVEVVAGLAMLLGAFVRYAGALLAIVMLVAMLITTSPKGFAGHELELVLFALSLGVALVGAGKYGLASRFEKA